MRAWFESERDAVTYAEGVTRFGELRVAWIEGTVVVYATIYVDRDEYGNAVQSVVKRRCHYISSGANSVLDDRRRRDDLLADLYASGTKTRYSRPSLSAAAALFFGDGRRTECDRMNDGDTTEIFEAAREVVRICRARVERIDANSWLAFGVAIDRLEKALQSYDREEQGKHETTNTDAGGAG